MMDDRPAAPPPDGSLPGVGEAAPGDSVRSGPPESETPIGRGRRSRYTGTHPRRFTERYKELDPQRYPDIVDHVRAQGRTPAGTHVPILVDEMLAALNPQPGEVVADGTLGYGGHATQLLERIVPGGRLFGFDVDAEELERTRQRLAPYGSAVVVRRSNFAGIDKVLREEGLAGYDVIFADLGVSSMQLEDPLRGFSYKHDGLLDMRMDDRLGRTAADVVAQWTQEQLSAAFWELADEPDHDRVAARIVARRTERPICSTLELVRLIFEGKGMNWREWRRTRAEERPALHPAARCFQALRMAVNDELGCLRHLLRIAPYCLRPGGRIGIIAFHSGEDDLVAQAFAAGLGDGVYAGVAEPVTPTAQERRSNPRSASAKFRWARRAES